MPSKRDNNAGSISKRNAKWRAQITTGHDPQTGKLVRASKTFKTKAEAQAWIVEQTNAINTGSYIVPSSYTIKSWCDEWLTIFKRNVKPTTKDTYNYVLTKFVYPNIGNELLQKVTPTQVQKLINSMLDNNVSSRTVAYTIIVLKSALQKAVDVGHVPKNVASVVEKPQVISKEAQYLVYEGRIRIVEACLSERIGIAYILILFTGLRKGECLGLRWVDINFSENFIYVTQSLGG